MKKFMKRSLAVLLVLVLCSGSLLCFAADTEKAYFADVSDDNPAKDAIVWADANGILKADRKGNFSPDATVSVLTFALTLFRGVTAEKMDLFRFIKAFSLLFGMLKENGLANLGADITRGAAAEKIVTYCGI